MVTWRFLLLGGLFVSSELAAAPGSIRGKVVDLEQRPVQAVVVLRRIDAGKSIEQTSGVDGGFRFDDVEAGTYGLSAVSERCEGGTLLNVGPSRIQPQPIQTVAMQCIASAKESKEAGGNTESVILAFFLTLSLACGLFVFHDRVNPFRLRVPMLFLAIWSVLPFAVGILQPSLLALRAEDAWWVGFWYVFGAFATWQARAAVIAGCPPLPLQQACPADAAWPRRVISSVVSRLSARPEWTPLVPGVFYAFWCLVLVFSFAIQSMSGGTPERQQFVSQGLATGGALLAAFTWLMKYLSGRLERRFPERLNSTATAVLVPCLLLLIGILTYVLSYRDRVATLESGTPVRFGSPMIHIFFLLAIIGLSLSLLGALLDRFGVPLLSPVLLLVLLGVVMGAGDYVFPTRPMTGAQRLTPAQTIEGRRRVILVSSAGGGVQAAAWSARVLGGLSAAHSDFAPSVRLVSGVSGGSVGSLYFMNTYPTALGGRGWTAEQAFRAAGEPLLEALSWGLVRDLAKALPFASERRIDRGRVLDRILAGRSQLGQAHLAQWAQNVNHGLPAVLLNATEVETGRAVAFSTTELSGDSIVDFGGAYGRDVEIATAVRLSATFPYVSPAARPEADGTVLSHIADGGYYDNFGIFALLEWLKQALHPTAPLPEILIIRIEAFPSHKTRVAQEPTGWPFQIGVPIATMGSVRGAAQTRRNDAELATFRKYYQQSGGQLHTVLFRYAPPPACSANPPLSWDLMPREVDCVDRAWNAESTLKSKEQVEAFLSRP